ncbi:hypothetical protein ACHAWU_004819 [Discostella pseudostelligera]|uniref:Uncharacterized protein n=1 Tax=Discostella pseudostelligera TaxID=259834 RepID=A0ABD3M882_9STRA
MRIVLLLSLFTLAKGNYRVGVGGFAASVSASSTSRNDNSVNANKSRNTYFLSARGGAAALNPFPEGYNPFGYNLTALGKTFLEFDGSLDSDVGRFLSTLKGGKRITRSRAMAGDCAGIEEGAEYADISKIG